MKQWHVQPDFLKLSKIYPQVSMAFYRNFVSENVHLTARDDIKYSREMLSFS